MSLHTFAYIKKDNSVQNRSTVSTRRAIKQNTPSPQKPRPKQSTKELPKNIKIMPVKIGVGKVPYNIDGDRSVNSRNLNWYIEKWIPKVKPFIFGEQYKTMLDVGAGNGRFNKLLHEWYDKIINIDAEDVLHKNFSYPNCTFFSKRLNLYDTDIKFDILISISTFLYLYHQYKDKVFYYFNNLLRVGGRFVIDLILSDSCHDVEMVEWYNSGNPKCPDGFKIIKIEQFHLGVQNKPNIFVIMEKTQEIEKTFKKERP